MYVEKLELLGGKQDNGEQKAEQQVETAPDFIDEEKGDLPF